MISLLEIKEKLIQADMKITHQRLVVYQNMMQMKGHPTAEEIFEKVRKKNPSISLGTVYKTLDAFEEHKLIYKVSTPGGKMRYDINLEPHNHIYSGNTNEIIDYFDDKLNELIQNYIKNKNIKNFTINDIRLQIKGDKIDPKKNILIE